ncbi:MAG: hypothetical protein OXP36_01280 [Gammaproteobacteria bacterium]|nr:hypothetical protein [Gammaproteobacteria bacterium]
MPSASVAVAIAGCLFSIMPCIGFEPETGASTSSAFQRFLRETDCSIAKGTRIVHYPTVHPAPGAPLALVLKDADYEFDPILVESGFNFVQFVKRRRNAVVFSEAYWTSNMVDEYREVRRALRRASDQSTASLASAAFVPWLLRDGSYNIRRIKKVLMETDEVRDLDATTKSLFETLTGADVAFVTGIIDDLLPSTTLGSVGEVFARFLRITNWLATQTRSSAIYMGSFGVSRRNTTWRMVPTRVQGSSPSSRQCN